MREFDEFVRLERRSEFAYIHRKNECEHFENLRKFYYYMESHDINMFNNKCNVCGKTLLMIHANRLMCEKKQ